jgi:hypothetical protein
MIVMDDIAQVDPSVISICGARNSTASHRLRSVYIHAVLMETERGRWEAQ